ncbi:hypothetical protein KA405_06820 [Patescibacteria group bacterium]|nr:hypothetical protein [Patescibacteria group bacterium]
MRKNKQKIAPDDTKKNTRSGDSDESTETFPPKKSLTYNEKHEFAALEQEITELQAQQESINLQFQADNLSHEQIKLLSRQL